ncbi:MAG: hypothetical protein KAG66_04205 [Methylococcales bacterium]|nr:hypothetical protein [Methylococcales bacterium]
MDLLFRDRGMAISLIAIAIFIVQGVEWTMAHGYFLAVFAVLEIFAAEAAVAGYSKNQGRKDMYSMSRMNGFKTLAMAALAFTLLFHCHGLVAGLATALIFFAASSGVLAIYLSDKPEIARHACNNNKHGPVAVA